MSIAINKIKSIIDTNLLRDENFKNFVLQGGAGSGKTESLKEIISYISEKYPAKKIACITHTNVAVDEIKMRVGNKYNISTIHSFLNDSIKGYKENIKTIIHQIFIVQNINEENHATFKKVHGKYSDKLFSIKKENCEKVIGKKEYDSSPYTYNEALNERIRILNNEIIEIINSNQCTETNNLSYNQTRFDSFRDLSFSHESLLSIAHMLCKKYSLLPKIISDKYDFIFIDEYQDTNEEIIELFLNLLPQNKKTTIGLFGDSMQGIYDDGIGDITINIKNTKLERINKEDNYRCSQQVIEFINIIRTDDIEQKLALKKDERTVDREGSVKLYYSLYGKKPTVFSQLDEKNKYLDALNTLINIVKEEASQKDGKLLMLTNKSISTEVGFENLYNVFSDRYTEVKEEIEKELSRIQITDIVELCKLYQTKDYNPLLVHLKKNGFEIKSVKDKKIISGHFEHITTSDLNLEQVLNYVFENKLTNKSERFVNYIERKSEFLNSYEANTLFVKLEKLYSDNGNTLKRLKDNHNLELTEEEFNDFENALKKKLFYLNLFSDKVKFHEVLKYFQYLNEETEYITMHKTKGSGIENVIVVLDEYFWNKYNFKSIYDEGAELEKRYKNQKLFYVASSRTIKNLVIIRLIEDETEEQMLNMYYRNCEIIKK